jgi:uncharacterized protein YtpQ (UPF0354 family)
MDEQDLCGRAIARLVARGGDGRPALWLPAPEAPVLTMIGSSGLLVGYVVDRGSYFLHVQRRHLVAERMSESDLHRRALVNLGMLLKDGTAEVYPCADCFLVVFDGNWEASLLLVDDLWDRQLVHLAPNGFVAAVPNMNILAFCDAKTPDGPLQLHRIIQSGAGDHPISTILYYRDPTLREWRPLRIRPRFQTERAALDLP